MRMFPKLLVTAALFNAASMQAQIAAGPAITTGGEISLSVLQQRPGSTTTLGAGLSVGVRSTGKRNISARLSYVNDPSGGSFGEVGTFGPLNALNTPSGMSVGWTAGLGYSEGRQGLYLPVGLNASRDFQVRTATVIPFAEARLIVEQIDLTERYLGTASMAAEIGMELRIDGRWGVRAGFGTSSAGANSAIGVARRM